MRAIIPILILTCTVSVVGQSIHERMLDAVARTLNGQMRIDSDTRSNWADTEVHIFAVHLLKKKQKECTQAIVDDARDKIIAAFKDFPQEKYSLVVSADIPWSETIVVGTGTPTYRVTPTRITTFCGGGFCTSTIYGGRVVRADHPVTRTRETTKPIAMTTPVQNY